MCVGLKTFDLNYRTPSLNLFSDWFYNLPCGYNFQLDTSMFQKGTEEIFPMYHNCTEEPKIYHGNGGTEIPIDDENVTPTRQIDTQ